MDSPIALFVLGHSATGKSYLTSRFITAQQRIGIGWCLLDKDAVSEVWSGPLLQAMGQDPNDRDSPFFKAHVRDLQYQSTLRVGKDQLELGINTVFPGPWSSELANSALFSPTALGFPAQTRLRHIWLELPEAVRKARITQRNDPRDRWKLDHWDAYFKALKRPVAVDDGRVPVLDASLPLAEQLGFLKALVR